MEESTAKDGRWNVNRVHIEVYTGCGYILETLSLCMIIIMRDHGILAGLPTPMDGHGVLLCNQV